MMQDNQKTPAQIRKEIAANNKANDALKKDLNKIAQTGIDKEIEAVEASLSTLIENADFDRSELKKKFKSLLKKCYGKKYVVKVNKIPHGSSFQWDELLQKMNENGIITKDKSRNKAQLEELYFGKRNMAFNKQWNDKPDKLYKDGKAASAKYFVQ